MALASRLGPDHPLVPRLDPSLFGHPAVVAFATPEYATARYGLAAGVGLVAVVVGALLPDLDSESSTLTTRRWFGFGYLFALIGLVVRTFLPHRGPLHSLLAGTLIALGVEFVVRVLSRGAIANTGWVLGAGFLSHLITDAMSLSGVALFWPAPLVIRLWPSYRVGSLAETALAWAGALGLTLLSLTK
jgi:uncharacterized metal-binding protein